MHGPGAGSVVKKTQNNSQPFAEVVNLLCRRGYEKIAIFDQYLGNDTR